MMQDLCPSGWLWKVGSQVPTWRRRYFVLEPGCLVYYKSKPPLEQLQNDSCAENAHHIKPIGAVILDTTCRIENVSSYSTSLNVSKKNCIRLLGGHGRCIILAPDISRSSNFNYSNMQNDPCLEITRDIKCWFDALRIEIDRLEMEALMLVERNNELSQKTTTATSSSQLMQPFPNLPDMNHVSFAKAQGENSMISGVALSSRPSRCFSAPIIGRSTNTSDQSIANSGSQSDANSSDDFRSIGGDSSLRLLLKSIPNVQGSHGGYVPKFEDLHFFFSPPENCIPLIPSHHHTLSMSSIKSSLSMSSHHQRISARISGRYSSFLLQQQYSGSSHSTSLSNLPHLSSLPSFSRSQSMLHTNNRNSLPVQRHSKLDLSSSLLYDRSSESSSSPVNSNSAAAEVSVGQNLRSSTLANLANQQFKGFNFNWEENEVIDQSDSDSD